MAADMVCMLLAGMIALTAHAVPLKNQERKDTYPQAGCCIGFLLLGLSPVGACIGCAIGACMAKDD